MALQFKLQFVLVTDDDEQVSGDELIVLNKGCERVEQWGLTLAEAKMLLLELQRQVLTRQIGAFLVSRLPCPTCRRSRGIKDHKTVLFGSLFGKLALASRGSDAVRASTMGRHPPVRWLNCWRSTPHLSCCIWRSSRPPWSRTD